MLRVCVQRDAERVAVLAHHPSHTAEANQLAAKVLQKQDTPLDAALTVAHAV